MAAQRQRQRPAVLFSAVRRSGPLRRSRSLSLQLLPPLPLSPHLGLVRGLDDDGGATGGGDAGEAGLCGGKNGQRLVSGRRVLRRAACLFPRARRPPPRAATQHAARIGLRRARASGWRLQTRQGAGGRGGGTHRPPEPHKSERPKGRPLSTAACHPSTTPPSKARTVGRGTDVRAKAIAEERWGGGTKGGKKTTSCEGKRVQRRSTLTLFAPPAAARPPLPFRH